MTCSICNVVCNCETVFNYHLAGQKHAAMVKKHAAAAGGGLAAVSHEEDGIVFFFFFKFLRSPKKKKGSFFFFFFLFICSAHIHLYNPFSIQKLLKRSFVGD